MKTHFSMLLDFILPKSETEQRLASIPLNYFYKKVSPAEIAKMPYATAFFSYKDPIIRDMIQAFKYRRKSELSLHFARIMYDFLLEELSDEQLLGSFTDPILIPIPLSRKKKDERGYNQTELIASDIMALSNDQFPAYTRVLRKKHTETNQAHTTQKGERKKNIIGSFYVKRPEYIEGRNIILIDDVITTGATIKEARKTLMEAGAKEVRALAIAH